MRATFRKMDKILLLLTIAFTILGLVMIFSASSITAVLQFNVSESYFFRQQLIAITLGWIGGIILLQIPTKTYHLFGRIGILGVLGALALLIPYGTITGGARRWFDLGFFSLQPSEFAKPIIIVYLAVYFEKIIKSKKINMTNIMTPFAFILIAAGLTAYQPDLGTAVVMGGIAFGIFMALPIDIKEMKLLKIGAIITLIIGIIFVFSIAESVLKPHQLNRLHYKEPCHRYTEPSGYQVCNGLIAAANGGLFGVGLGNSTQKYLYLPEAHTDFIFPIIIEELGAIPSVFIIIGYILLLYRILCISKNAGSLRGSIMAYGVFLMLLAHLLVNFMGVLALIPLTGISVPFLSYGGSFYITVIGGLFIVQKIQIESADAKKERVLGD